MFQIILNALNLKASSKTQKYFLSSTYFNETFPSFVNTIVAVITASQSNGNINIGDEVFKVSDYSVPTFVEKLSKRYRIFFNEKSYYFGKPIIEGRLLVNPEVQVLTPFEFEKFIKGYNENQSEVIDCNSHINVRQVSFLYEISYVTIDNDTYCVGSSSDAKLEFDELCSLLLSYDVSIDVKSYCHNQIANNEGRLVEWLVENML